MPENVTACPRAVVIKAVLDTGRAWSQAFSSVLPIEEGLYYLLWLVPGLGQELGTCGTKESTLPPLVTEPRWEDVGGHKKACLLASSETGLQNK